MAEQIVISEFSLRTEIIVASDGIWNYRNLSLHPTNFTLSSIPKSIEQAIQDGAFLVPASHADQLPVVMGRVVLDWQEGLHWSVIAVLTCSQDSNTNQQFADYRFFLCPGVDKLWQLADWLDSERQRLGNFPKFDPSPSSIASYITYLARSPSPLLLNPQDWERIHVPALPIALLPDTSYTLQQVHQIATQAATFQYHAIAWAVGIDMPQTPAQFQVIHFANDPAYQTFQERRLKPLVNDLYPFLLPRLWRDFEDFIRNEIKQQSPNTIFPGTAVYGSYQPEVAPHLEPLSADSLLAWYNDAPNELLAYIHEVILAAESLRRLALQVSLPDIHLEIRRGGNYWIVAAPPSPQDDSHDWLVPKADLKITPHQYNEVITRLFECTGYEDNQVRLFKLVRPAKVRPLPNGRSWRFMEKGVLSFESN